MSAPIRRVLIANRGAIATRIQRTLKRLGVESVALYAEADHASRHVTQADAAVALGEALPRRPTRRRKGPRRREGHGADAIHPGYGFLSENPAFSAAVKRRVSRSWGRPPQIEAFGLKHEARRLAIEAEVPCFPAILASADEAVAEAERIGYRSPSSAGSGGIGMRIAEAPEALRDAWASVRASRRTASATAASSSSASSAKPVVEVQVFETARAGDRPRRPRLLLQRRNQKIVEEAPAPAYPTPFERPCTARPSASWNPSATAPRAPSSSSTTPSAGVYFLEVNAAQTSMA